MALTAEEQMNLRNGVRRRSKWRALWGVLFPLVAVALTNVFTGLHHTAHRSQPAHGHPPLSLLILIIVGGLVALGFGVGFTYRMQRRQADSLPYIAGADRHLRARVRRALRAGHSDDRLINGVIADQRDYVVPRIGQQRFVYPVLLIGCAALAAVPVGIWLRIIGAAAATLLAAGWILAEIRIRQLRHFTGRTA